MLNIKFEINGRQVKPENTADALEAAFLDSIEQQIRKKLDGIRDPETGEFPVVCLRGQRLDNLSIEISGSPQLVALVRSNLGAAGEIVGCDAIQSNTEKGAPSAFLCHSSKDKELARKIAKDFQSQGIETFFDEWEITPGDSLRQRIDAGLDRCTHFVALLTQNSIEAPWVKVEMDAAFVQKVSGKCKFIPLRFQLAVDALPPLLQALNAPELKNYDEDVKTLVHAIHGVTKKPALGPAPSAVQNHMGTTDLSPAAELIARLMIERSEYGDSFDPQLDGTELRAATRLPDDDLIDAIDELEGQGLVRKHVTMGCGALGFAFVTSEAALFSELDQCFMSWNPEEDAVRLAAELINEGDNRVIPVIAEKLGWPPRRMNPALNFLIARDLVDSSQACGTHPWSTHWISKTQKTKRFLRDRG